MGCAKIEDKGWWVSLSAGPGITSGSYDFQALHFDENTISRSRPPPVRWVRVAASLIGLFAGLLEPMPDARIWSTKWSTITAE
jgi:hypothetical protein